ncbi:hypothetical protein RIF29_00814 [Crotalaria pallida]|uniref:NADH dehydrogenase [ubiquinone] 1 alpha subcomplex subunit 12 n=1 Tax=Crotalaria pallida TaxID=3830 RepID=A0AAN9IX63_CROPI
MRRLLGKISGFISNRTFVGTDRAGNKYFTRNEEVDGILKEKRWVVFKGEEDPTSIPVEWICWLNGQRRKAPTLQEMLDLEARRERVKQNVALLKKEEEEKRAIEGRAGKRVSIGKVSGPDLKSFIQQVGAPVPTEGDEVEESSGPIGSLSEFLCCNSVIVNGELISCYVIKYLDSFHGTIASRIVNPGNGYSLVCRLWDLHEKASEKAKGPESAEPTGSGASFKPGTWQPPT